jgi:hypothetical protein
MFQVKTGTRNIVMPGARIVSTVVMMFTAVRIVPVPVRTMPTSTRSRPIEGL